MRSAIARSSSRSGRIVADDTPQALEARSRYHNAVTLGFADPAELARARGALEAHAAGRGCGSA